MFGCKAKKNRYEAAFTLIELSIVIVIIAVIAAGVLQGQEMIAQAKVRKLVRQIHEADTAKNAFITQYEEIPGDFSKAVEYNLDANTADTQDVDHDGNGDNMLQDANGGYVNYTGEIMNFWIHLTNAQLIEGGFAQKDGCAADGTGCDYRMGIAYPFTPISHGIIAVTADAGIEYMIGLAYIGETGTDLIGASLNPRQAYSVDSKLDDGSPDTGRIIAIIGYGDDGSPAFTNDTASVGGCFEVTGAYNVAVENFICTLRVRSSAN